MNITSIDKKQDDQSSIEELAPELLRGPEWLKNKRLQEREEFNTLPLPRRGLHLWRYTDPARFLIDSSSIAATAFAENLDTTERLERKHLREGLLDFFVVDRGGRDIQVHKGSDKGADSITVCSLSEALAQHESLVEEHLYSLVNAQTGKFEALNGALWNDGLFIYVPKGVSLKHPIHLLRETGLANSVQFPRLLVIVGENAEVTIIDEYSGGSTDIKQGASYSNGVVEIVGLDDSRTRYVSLQRQTPATLSYLTHRARISRDATMLTVTLDFGGSISKHNIGINMAGVGSRSDVYGLLFGTNRQQFDTHTLHHHSAGNTYSNIDFKVALRDKATSAYTGLIRIDHNARNCEAYQENRNLLLTKGTRAETIPELEILNQDVMCSHGATFGPVDPMQIFYLKSRGIKRREAVRMITSGFVASTIQRVPEDLRERVHGFVDSRLEDI